MDTGKVSEMSAQIGQKAPDFKMQGIFKGEIRDVHLEDFTGKGLRRTDAYRAQTRLR